MFGTQCNFLAGIVDGNDIPVYDLPEIAFWGKSNVGKSSLINAITNHKLLARVSNTPGRTKQLNFFEIDQSIIFVDLPGYGYARASKHDKASWQRLIRTYLAQRSNLRRVFVLVDVRHKLRDHDLEVMTLLDTMAVSYQLIFTKCDKRDKDALDWDMIFADLLKKHSALFPSYLMTSARSKFGIEPLRISIVEFKKR